MKRFEKIAEKIQKEYKEGKYCTISELIGLQCKYCMNNSNEDLMYEITEEGKTTYKITKCKYVYNLYNGIPNKYEFCNDGVNAFLEQEEDDVPQ